MKNLLNNNWIYYGLYFLGIVGIFKAPYPWSMVVFGVLIALIVGKSVLRYKDVEEDTDTEMRGH